MDLTNINNGDTQNTTPTPPSNMNDATAMLMSNLTAPQEPVTEPVTEPTELIDQAPDQTTAPVQNVAPQTQSIDFEAMKADLLNGVREMVMSGKEPEGEPPYIEQSTEDGTLSVDSDEFLEMFADNPGKAIETIANQIADGKVKGQLSELTDRMRPVLDQADMLKLREESASVFNEFAGEHPDVSNYAEKMAQLITERGVPINERRSFEDAYKDAKLEDLEANKGKSFDDYLGDDNYRQQIFGNEDIKKQIIEDYLKELQDGGTPRVISDGGGTRPTATSPKSNNSIKDAGKIFASRLG